MKNNPVILILLLCVFAIINSLDLLAQTKYEGMASLVINVQNVVGDQPLALEDSFYLNDKGERFNITTCNYFISNIKLHNKNGIDYIVPQDDSYFLLKQNDSASKYLHMYIPVGAYTSVTFTLGVDSLRSTMDISRRTGALDIAGGMQDGMYWTWNSGYLFFKMEGTCDLANVDHAGQKKFQYHIGGFGGYNKPSLNNIHIITLDLAQNGEVKAQKNGNNRIIVKADIGQVFNGKTKMSIAKYPGIMFGEMSKVIADNYSGMFSHLSTTN